MFLLPKSTSAGVSEAARPSAACAVLGDERVASMPPEIWGLIFEALDDCEQWALASSGSYWWRVFKALVHPQHEIVRAFKFRVNEPQGLVVEQPITVAMSLAPGLSRRAQAAQEYVRGVFFAMPHARDGTRGCALKWLVYAKGYDYFVSKPMVSFATLTDSATMFELCTLLKAQTRTSVRLRACLWNSHVHVRAVVEQGYATTVLCDAIHGSARRAAADAMQRSAYQVSLATSEFYTTMHGLLAAEALQVHRRIFCRNTLAPRLTSAASFAYWLHDREDARNITHATPNVLCPFGFSAEFLLGFLTGKTMRAELQKADDSDRIELRPLEAICVGAQPIMGFESKHYLAVLRRGEEFAMPQTRLHTRGGIVYQQRDSDVARFFASLISTEAKPRNAAHGTLILCPDRATGEAWQRAFVTHSKFDSCLVRPQHQVMSLMDSSLFTALHKLIYKHSVVICTHQDYLKISRPCLGRSRDYRLHCNRCVVVNPLELFMELTEKEIRNERLLPDSACTWAILQEGSVIDDRPSMQLLTMLAALRILVPAHASFDITSGLISMMEFNTFSTSSIQLAGQYSQMSPLQALLYQLLEKLDLVRVV
jgi:hypothetical protein